MRRYTDVPPRQTDISRQLNALAQDGVRYLIVHKRLIGEEHWTRWERYLAIRPRYEDDEIAVYSTQPEAGLDFDLEAELIPGLGLVRAIVSRPCARPGSSLDVDVAWGATIAPGRDWDVELALASQAGLVWQSVVAPIAPDWPARDWPANAVAWGYYTLPILGDLPPAAYDLVVTLEDAGTGMAAGRPVRVGQVVVQSAPCALAVPEGAVDVNALFGDEMRLLGYRLGREKDSVALTLIWRSERRMEADFKVFVHIFDPATGIPVAQDDAMPLHWTYPTSYWAPGETVTDEISISIEGVPSGMYGLAVGVYDPADGERLPVRDVLDQLQPDGRLVFPRETVEIE
jgi:hypothetical protein